MNCGFCHPRLSQKQLWAKHLISEQFGAQRCQSNYMLQLLPVRSHPTTNSQCKPAGGKPLKKALMETHRHIEPEPYFWSGVH